MMLVRELGTLQAHLAPNSLTCPLLLVTFCAGVLDTTTYFNFVHLLPIKQGAYTVLFTRGLTVIIGIHSFLYRYYVVYTPAKRISH
jgi:hypothetical protein